MRSGLLTEVIKILQPQKIQSDYGEEKFEYVDWYTTRARVDFDPASRTVENDEVLFNTVLRLTVRLYVPVQDLDAIEWNGKRYRIISIQPKREFNEKYITVELINE